MAEAAFANTFLSTLDSRPVKLSASHVEDARKYPARPPYILPRMPKPMSKPTRLAPGQERSVAVALKSLRNPPLDIRLSSQPLDTSVLEVKHAVRRQTRIPLDKLKLLLNKRPVPDSKILRELVGDADYAIEFAVMVIGGAAAVPPPEEDEAAAKDDEPTGAAAADTEAFWTDLDGFLMQRLKDETTAKELSGLFRSSWEAHRSKP